MSGTRFLRSNVTPVSRFRPLDDDWYHWVDDSRPESIRVRVQEGDDGRIRLVALEVEGNVSAEVLRSIPVGRIEAAANAELHHTGERPPKRPSATIPASLRSNAV